MADRYKIAVQTVVRLAGGPERLGRAIGVTRQAVDQWQRIPVKHVLVLERLLHVPRHKQRPDFYPPP